MGHRKQRKRARKQSARQWDDDRLFADPALEQWLTPRPDDEPPPAWQWQDAFAAVGRPPMKTCGGCREFVEEMENGRGTCLPPGSGILSPWTDTEACPFYEAARVTRRAR